MHSPQSRHNHIESDNNNCNNFNNTLNQDCSLLINNINLIVYIFLFFSLLTNISFGYHFNKIKRLRSKNISKNSKNIHSQTEPQILSILFNPNNEYQILSN